jgi:hypothetical protein
MKPPCVNALPALVLVLAAAPAVADEPVEKSCGVITHEENGAPKTTPIEGFKVIEQTSKEGAFALPRGAPKNVQAVICKRSTIMPAAHDYKVLQAGLTLYLTDELDRVAALGLVDGQVTLDMLDGAMTEVEQSQVASLLRALQAQMR